MVREDIYCKKEFLDFLEIEKEDPSMAVNQLEALAEIVNPQMGFRDGIFKLGNNFAITILHYVKVTSRLDSYLSGIFKKKQKDTSDTKQEINDKETVGLMQFLVRKKSTSPLITDYEMHWQRKYKSQAICLAFSEPLMIIAVGLDNGDIECYKIDGNNFENKEIDEFSLKKAHSGRVMKLIINDKGNKIYSIGEDKKFRVTNLKTKEPESSTINLNPSPKEL